MNELRKDLLDFLEWNGISQKFLAEYIMGIDRKTLGKFLNGQKKTLTEVEIKVAKDFMDGKYFMTLNQMKADPDYIKSKQEEMKDE